MGCWPVEIELMGRTYEVPALPAMDWWPILVGLDLMAVLDLIEDDSLDDAMIDSGPASADLQPALVDALEAVAGRSLHVAYVLAVTAEQNWMGLNGDLIRRGFRWDMMPLAAALDAIYATMLSRFQKQEDLDAWLKVLDDDSLTAPGKKRTASQKARAEFENMAGPRPTGGVRSTGEQSGSAHPRTRSQPRPRLRGGRSAEPTPQP